MNKASKALKVIECIQKVIGKSSYENNIPLHEPFFKNTNAFEYTKNCIDSGWVSSNGKWVKAFEEEISKYTNSKHTIALSNGTDALRLALHCVGVSHGDEVILPPFTFVATANAVAHLGAIPNFLDIEENNLGLSPEILEENLQKIVIQRENCSYNKFTGNKISAIIAVHVFGFPARILDLKKISDKWGIPLIEDSAEALGSWTLSISKKTHCGLIGDAGILSFNGNKIITTGGGGALITNNSNIAKKARHLSTTAKLNHPWEFLHDEIGWNDRLPNINAALGVSQLEVLKERLELKKKLKLNYEESFMNFEDVEILNPGESSQTNNWLISIRLSNLKSKEARETRDLILKLGFEKGILMRPAWEPLHNLPMYKNHALESLYTAEDQFSRIINLPSSPQILLS